eukprot:TRINITY_DN21581_c0_g1_i1.p1 TRINITY_DN21581_c0_g1~~TRINITY_DN21581_c0_g1_i1.p1  ORF type:complete len:1102 (+),score=139.00 TRINITY_DN21581_c0_g1_i1:379-3306(+)
MTALTKENLKQIFRVGDDQVLMYQHVFRLQSLMRTYRNTCQSVFHVSYNPVSNAMNDAAKSTKNAANYVGQKASEKTPQVIKNASSKAGKVARTVGSGVSGAANAAYGAGSSAASSAVDAKKRLTSAMDNYYLGRKVHAGAHAIASVPTKIRNCATCIRDRVADSFSRAVRPLVLLRAPVEEACYQMEEDHPELAYLWAAEILENICPMVVPYTVSLELSGNERGFGFAKRQLGVKDKHQLLHSIPQENLAQLQKLAGNSDFRKAIKGKNLQEAGGVFKEWLLKPDPEVFKKSGLKPVVFDKDRTTVPIRPDGMVKFDQWFPGVKDRMKVPINSTFFAKLMKSHKVHSLENSAPEEEPLDRLEALTTLQALIKQQDAGRSLRDVLDPFELLDIVGDDEELLGYKIVGFREPSLTEKGVANAAFACTAFLGVAGIVGVMTAQGFGIGAAGGSIFMGVGAVPMAAVGAIVGAGIGLVAGITLAGSKDKSVRGSIILQGWKLVAKPDIFFKQNTFQVEASVDGYYLNHMKSTCAFKTVERYQGANKDAGIARFTVPTNVDKGTHWRPADEKSLTDDVISPDYWTNILTLMSVVRNRYFDFSFSGLDKDAEVAPGLTETRRVKKILQKNLKHLHKYYKPVHGENKTSAQLVNSLEEVYEGASGLAARKIPSESLLDANKDAEPADVIDMNTFESEKKSLASAAWSAAKSAAPELGDQPWSCVWKKKRYGFTILYDTVLGVNGRGGVCRLVAGFLGLANAGMFTLLVNPIKWALQAFLSVRPPTFWYEGMGRASTSVTPRRMGDLLLRAASLDPLGGLRARDGQTVLELQFDDTPRPSPIYAYLVDYNSHKDAYYRGPRMAVVSAHEKIQYTDIRMSAEGLIYLKTQHGWLGLCRYTWKDTFNAVQESSYTIQECFRWISTLEKGSLELVSFLLGHLKGVSTDLKNENLNGKEEEPPHDLEAEIPEEPEPEEDETTPLKT